MSLQGCHLSSLHLMPVTTFGFVLHTGLLDEVRVWDHVRSRAEISEVRARPEIYVLMASY